jgi:hypothetical protein
MIRPAPAPNYGFDLIGCISYIDQFKGTHHTRFLFMSQSRISDIKAGEQMRPSPMNQSAD